MDIPRGMFLEPHNLPHWHYFPIRDCVAEAFGLPAQTVTKRAEVIPAVEAARKNRQTVVIDFKVEQEDTVYPMVPAGAALDAMIRRPSPSPIIETGADVL